MYAAANVVFDPQKTICTFFFNDFPEKLTFLILDHQIGVQKIRDTWPTARPACSYQIPAFQSERNSYPVPLNFSRSKYSAGMHMPLLLIFPMKNDLKRPFSPSDIWPGTLPICCAVSLPFLRSCAFFASAGFSPPAPAFSGRPGFRTLQAGTTTSSNSIVSV